MLSTDIVFRESDHAYFATGRQGVSVNGVLKDLGFTFDEKYWSLYKALELLLGKPNFKETYKQTFGFNYNLTYDQLLNGFYPKVRDFDINLAIEDILKQWQNSRILGTEFHKLREIEAYERGYLLNPFNNIEYEVKPKPIIPAAFDNAASYIDLSLMDKGVYLEALIFNRKFKLFGQVDVLFVDSPAGSNCKVFWLNDYKTNTNKPKIYIRDSGDSLLDPLKGMGNNTHTKYECQLSLYAGILEEWGLSPQEIGYTHFKDYDVTKSSLRCCNYHRQKAVEIIELVNLFY